MLFLCETTKLVEQCFSIFSMKGAKSRLVTLLESSTKNFNTSQLAHFVSLQNKVCYTKY